MSNSLLPPRFLFRYAAPCLYRDPLWTAAGAPLDEECRIIGLEELDGRRAFADVRFAWNEKGFAFRVRVEGKKRPLRCDVGRPLESDGLQIWIDTRDTHNIHRAGRFCHRFVFLPAGHSRRSAEPWAEQVAINRARENPHTVSSGDLHVKSENRIDGYLLEGFISAAALTGFDPSENERLGFTYLLFDHELGEQTFSCPHPFPYHEDPSLWGTLDLVK